jgi:hypothetical protein
MSDLDVLLAKLHELKESLQTEYGDDVTAASYIDEAVTALAAERTRYEDLFTFVGEYRDILSDDPKATWSADLLVADLSVLMRSFESDKVVQRLFTHPDGTRKTLEDIKAEIAEEQLD